MNNLIAGLGFAALAGLAARYGFDNYMQGNTVSTVIFGAVVLIDTWIAYRSLREWRDSRGNH